MEPELLWTDIESGPVCDRTGWRERLVRGGEVYITCSLGRRTKPSRWWSITQLSVLIDRYLGIEGNELED